MLIEGKYTAALDLLKEEAVATEDLDIGIPGWSALHTLYLFPPHQFDGNGASRAQVAELLIEGGVDVDGQIEHTGTTALHFAALQGKGGVEELLLLKADPTIKDDGGIPAEFWAAAARNMDDSERLRVAAGNPINVALPDGTTKAEWASEGWKHLEVVRKSFQNKDEDEEENEEEKEKGADSSASIGWGRLDPFGLGSPIQAKSDFCYDEYRDDQRACRSRHRSDVSRCYREARNAALWGLFGAGGSALLGGGGLGFAFSLLTASSSIIYTYTSCVADADRDRGQCLSDAEDEYNNCGALG